MKTFFNVLVVLILLGQGSVSAAPYYRFWRGWKLDQLSRPQFENGLNAGFISSTVRVGAGRGLIGYLPVLLPAVASSHSLPDEVALVVYSNEVDYNAIRSTAEGKAYADSHWLWFDKNKGSKSLTPERYQGVVENEKAYDVLQSNADWKQGHGLFVTSKINGDIRPYINAMRTEFSQRGLISYLVLVHGSVLYEYQLWKDYATLKANWPALRGQAAKHALIYSSQLSTQLKKQDWKSPQLVPGLGLNITF